MILIVSIPDICVLPHFLYSHEYRLTRNTVTDVYCVILSDQIVVGCPLGVPILYYVTYQAVLWCNPVVVDTVDKAYDYMSRCQEQLYVTYQVVLWCSLVVVGTVDKASDYMSRCQEQ